MLMTIEHGNLHSNKTYFINQNLNQANVKIRSRQQGHSNKTHVMATDFPEILDVFRVYKIARPN